MFFIIIPPEIYSFNSRPHEEVDIRSRLLYPVIMSLSIHDLTRRSTQVPPSHHLCTRPFNSRPHEEVDNSRRVHSGGLSSLSIHDLTRRSTTSGVLFAQVIDLSIHDLTRRSTSLLSLILVLIPFNSRPHEEVDRSICSSLSSNTLSIHDLTRRSTPFP